VIQNVEFLKDGKYPSRATLHNTGGEATVVLRSTFDLSPGATIPLSRKENNLKAVSNGVDDADFGDGDGYVIILLLDEGLLKLGSVAPGPVALRVDSGRY